MEILVKFENKLINGKSKRYRIMCNLSKKYLHAYAVYGYKEILNRLPLLTGTGAKVRKVLVFLELL